MRLSDILADASFRLRSSGVQSNSLDARLLLSFVLGLSQEKLLANPDLIISQKKHNDFQRLIKRRIEREPISQLTGKREFYGQDFMVSSSVLDPRPDSEVLIESILEHYPNPESNLKILELGVGSGCLILSILSKFSNSSGIAIDIKQEALEVAKTNSKSLRLSDRIKFIRSDWFAKLNKSVDGFDLIISNPPYIPTDQIPHLQPEIFKYEPKVALDGGFDGLECYRKISKEVSSFLKDGGYLFIEIGFNQDQPIIKIFEQESGLKLTGSKKDLSGITRCLIFKKT